MNHPDTPAISWPKISQSQNLQLQNRRILCCSETSTDWYRALTLGNIRSGSLCPYFYSSKFWIHSLTVKIVHGQTHQSCVNYGWACCSWKQMHRCARGITWSVPLSHFICPSPHSLIYDDRANIIHRRRGIHIYVRLFIAGRGRDWRKPVLSRRQAGRQASVLSLPLLLFPNRKITWLGWFTSCCFWCCC